MRLSILSKELSICFLLHSQTASIITTEDIQIITHKIDNAERSLFEKIDESHSFINSKASI
jgi:hypothetical protein